MMVDTNKTVFWTTFVFIVTYAWVLRIFELPYFRQETGSDLHNVFDRYFNAIWVTIITCTTVGYGDFAPSTFLGRCTGIFMAFTGSFLISIVIVCVTQSLDLESDQLLALRHINITRLAAKTLQKALKFFQIKKKYYLLKDIVEKRKYEKEILNSGRVSTNNEYRPTMFIKRLKQNCHAEICKVHGDVQKLLTDSDSKN